MFYIRDFGIFQQCLVLTKIIFRSKTLDFFSLLSEETLYVNVYCEGAPFIHDIHDVR